MKLNEKMKELLFLFDIDGTILDSQGYGKKAFIEAFEEFFNVKINFKLNFSGGIDNVIFRKLYNHFNFNLLYYESLWENFKELYISKLEYYANTTEWTLFKNVDKTIEKLYKNSHIALATGNIKKGAFIKLKKFNLDRFFATGGFGDKACERKDFIKEAILSTEDFTKKKFKKENIYLFGDTELDIISAKANKINSVLIINNTNYFDKLKIKKIRPDYCGSFLYIDNFFELITNSRKNKNILFFNNE